MYEYELRRRFLGKFFGKYRGVVSDNADPEKLGRIKAKVPSVMGKEEDLGWGFPITSSGGKDNVGDVIIPAVGDHVWIEFENGDPERPLWSPGPWPKRGGRSTMPRHGRGEPDKTDYAARDFGVAPPTQYEGQYSWVRTFQGRDGSFLEFDATPGSERVQLFHYTGSRLEMVADGSVQEVSVGGLRRMITGVEHVQAGAQNVLINGEKVSRINGNTNETYGGNVTRSFNSVNESGSNYSGSWSGSHETTSSGAYKVKSSGNGSFSFVGQLSMMIGANLQISSLENIDITASASTTGESPPSSGDQIAINIHGYNGKSIFKATDVTGLAKTISLEHHPLVSGVANSIWKVENAISGIGGQIQLKETPASPVAANVFLGKGSTEPVIKGTSLVSWLKKILLVIQTHTHEVAVAAATPSKELTNPLLGIPLIQKELDVPGKIVSYTVETA